MAVTPTAPIAVLMDRLRWQIGNAAAWVAWTGKAPATAIESVYVYSPEAWNSDTGPFAIIEMGDTYIINRDGLQGWRHAGTFMLAITAAVPEAYADVPLDAYIDFVNHVGALEKELRFKPRGPNFINLQGVNYWSAPVRTTPEDREGGVGDWMQCVLQLTVEQGDP